MSAFWQDARYGARMLLKKPGFTLIAVITLGLGIGAVTAIFSVVDAVLLRPLPYKEPERIALIEQHFPKLDLYFGGVSAPEMLDYIAGNETFAEMAGYGIIKSEPDGRTRASAHSGCARFARSHPTARRDAAPGTRFLRR